MTEASIKVLYRIHGKAELVNGTIVVLPPSGGLAGRARLAILANLHAYSKRIGTGCALPGTVGFVVDLPHRKSFCPDASYHIGPVSMKLVTGAPVFAAEVGGNGDHDLATELVATSAKRLDYFAAGTKVVWDVDLHGPDTIRSYRADEPDRPLVFRRGDSAHAEPAVPGWSMPVDDLWT